MIILVVSLCWLLIVIIQICVVWVTTFPFLASIYFTCFGGFNGSTRDKLILDKMILSLNLNFVVAFATKMFGSLQIKKIMPCTYSMLMFNLEEAKNTRFTVFKGYMTFMSSHFLVTCLVNLEVNVFLVKDFCLFKFSRPWQAATTFW